MRLVCLVKKGGKWYSRGKSKVVLVLAVVLGIGVGVGVDDAGVNDILTELEVTWLV